MKHPIPVLLQVNGIQVDSVRIRASSELRDGAEIVIQDGMIGEFALTDDCAVNVRAIAGGEWRKVYVQELLSILRPAHNEASEAGINSEDVLERKLFSPTYDPQPEKEIIVVTSQEWEWSIRKAAKALFTRGIPHFVLSSYTPRSRQRNPQPIQFYVPDPAAACEWLCRVGFNPVPSTDDQVVDPDTLLTLWFRKGRTI
jgi:hypothetical protein